MSCKLITKEIQEGVINIVEEIAYSNNIKFKSTAKEAILFSDSSFEIITDCIELSDNSYFDEEEFYLAIGGQTQYEYDLVWVDFNKGNVVYAFEY